jgi:hypothetical protein
METGTQLVFLIRRLLGRPTFAGQRVPPSQIFGTSGGSSPDRILGGAIRSAVIFLNCGHCPEGQRREAFSDAEKCLRADRSRIRENSECSQIVRILTNSATKMLHGVARCGKEPPCARSFRMNLNWAL